MLGWFFNRTAEFDAKVYGQDAAGGRLPTPTVVATSVPCCVQQDSRPEPTSGQGRTGTVAKLRIFFQASSALAVSSIQSLKTRDVIKVNGFPKPLVLTGPPFDASGRGVVFEATAEDIR